MPFCSHCGSVVDGRDRFCARCGSRQPVGAPANMRDREPFQDLSPRSASILCYIPVIGWILAVVVLASDRFRNSRGVRFHAFQGLYLFAIWLFIHWAVRPVFQNPGVPGYRADRLLEAVMFGVWVFMMIKASRGEEYALPLIGELAQRSASEH